MAVPLVQIMGKVVLPDGTVPSSGGIACELSQPGSVLDGVTSQRVAARSTATIAADGSVSFSLVPNDAITPAGTCYLVYVWAMTPSGVRSWQETWQLASAPSPINVGAIPRLNVVPGTLYPTDLSNWKVAATGSTFPLPLSDWFAQVLNVKAFGASGSPQTTTGSISSGSSQLAVASAIDFAVGQGISVAGAGVAGALLVAKIVAVSGTALALDTAAGTTVSGAVVKHDDTAAIQAAINAGPGTGSLVYMAPGWYPITSTLTLRQTTQLAGAGGSWIIPPVVPAASSRSSTILDASLLGNMPAIQTAGNSSGVILRDFGLSGPSNPGLTSNFGILISYADESLLLGVNVAGFWKGIVLQNTYGTMLINSGTQSAQMIGLEVYASGPTKVIGGGFQNTTGQGQTGAANVKVWGNSTNVDLQPAAWDEAFSTGGGSKCLEVLGAADVHIAGPFFYPTNGYGIKLGDGTNNPARVTIDRVRMDPFDGGHVPTNTISIAAGTTGVRLANISTNPNGGGDINDLATDTVWWNVNGKFKLPSLPSANPGAGSKQLWYDPADGNRVKFAP